MRYVYIYAKMSDFHVPNGAKWEYHSKYNPRIHKLLHSRGTHTIYHFFCNNVEFDFLLRK